MVNVQQRQGRECEPLVADSGAEARNAQPVPGATTGMDYETGGSDNFLGVAASGSSTIGSSAVGGGESNQLRGDSGFFLLFSCLVH